MFSNLTLSSLWMFVYSVVGCTNLFFDLLTHLPSYTVHIYTQLDASGHDAKLPKDLHLRRHSLSLCTTKCVCVGVHERGSGLLQAQLLQNKKKTWWNKQQTSWPGAIAYTGWLIAFNDGVFDWCHVNEQMIGAFWSQTSRGVKKTELAWTWVSLQTKVVWWGNSWLPTLTNTLICQKNLSVLLPSLLASQTCPLSPADLPCLSQTSIIYTCLRFKWEQLWADERAMPWGFLTLVGFYAQADTILHSLSQVLFPG